MSRWKIHLSLLPELPTLSSMVIQSSHLTLSPTLAVARRIPSSARKIEWQQMSGTSEGTQLEPWIESESNTLLKGLGLLLLRCSGQPVLPLLILCTVPTVCKDEDPLDQGACRHLCTGRCLGQKVEGSSGVFQNNQRGSASPFQKSQRTAATMT